MKTAGAARIEIEIEDLDEFPKRKEVGLGGRVNGGEDSNSRGNSNGGKNSSRLSWWKWLVGGILLVAAVGMAVSYGRKEMARAQLKTDYETQITAAQTAASEMLTGVKNKVVEKDVAVTELEKHEVALSSIEVALIDETAESEAKVLLNKTRESLKEKNEVALAAVIDAKERVSGREKLGVLAPIYDLAIAQADFENMVGAWVQNKGWFVAKNQAAAISVDMGSKRYDKLTLESTAGNRLLTAHNTSNFYQVENENGGRKIAAYNQSVSNDGGDTEVANSTEKIAWPDGLTGETVAILAGENNMYFIQKEGGAERIYRQRINPKNETEKILVDWWEKNEVAAASVRQPSFERLTDATIDNSLWLAQNDGQVFKMTSGNVSKWQLKNLSEELSGELRVDTDYENDSGVLVILAVESGKVIVADKMQGEVRREVYSESFVGAVDVMVSGGEGKIYVVGRTAVWEVPAAEM